LLFGPFVPGVEFLLLEVKSPGAKSPVFLCGAEVTGEWVKDAVHFIQLLVVVL